MNQPRKKISRRLHEYARTDDPIQPRSLHIVMHDRWGRQVSHFDFNKLGIHPGIASLLADAFAHYFADKAAATTQSRWKDVRLFSRFLSEVDTVTDVTDLDTQLIHRFVEWLNVSATERGAQRKLGSRARAYGTLKLLLQWLYRHRPNSVPTIRFPTNPFPGWGYSWEPRGHLAPEHLSAILKACEIEINRIWTKFERGQAIAASKPTELPQPLSSREAAIWYLHDQYGAVIPPYKAFLATPAASRTQQTLSRWQGINEMASNFCATLNSVIPYYLAILIQTAGNPEAILNLQRDCLRPIPLNPELETVSWMKPRAGRIQRRLFSVKKRFHPPALIRQMLAMTEPLVNHVFAPDRNRLFLFTGAGPPRALGAMTLWKNVARFIQRHRLPPFTLASLRPTVLGAYYRATSDIKQVQMVAQHAQVATTVRYLQSTEVRDANRRQIAEHQAALVQWFEASVTRGTVQNALNCDEETAQAVVDRRHATTFGFTCRDPFAGIGPLARKRVLCPAFTGCFTCPNAVIFLDNATLARLLQARDHLRAARGAMDDARWSTFYQPQVHILEQDLIPRFNPELFPTAQLLREQLPPLPDLR